MFLFMNTGQYSPVNIAKTYFYCTLSSTLHNVRIFTVYVFQ
jgi:hypothetical protein